MKKFILLFILIVSGGLLRAQDNCANAVLQAQSMYEKGNFNSAIEQLLPCISSTKNASTLWQAYKLLSLCYLYTDDKVKAREYAVKMMKTNPAYKPSVLKDPADFVTLINGINIIPKFALGVSLSGGLNFTYPIVVNNYNLAEFKKKYSYGNGNTFGSNISYNFSRKFQLETGLFYNIKKYSITYFINGFDVSINNKTDYIEIPLLLKYSWGNYRLSPYIKAGINVGYLINAQADFQSVYLPDNSATKYETLYYPMRNNRSAINLSAALGAGVSYRIFGGNIFLNYTYFKGMNNINSGPRYLPQPVFYNYYYIDDDVVLDNSAFTIGYIQYLSYKVK